MAMMIHVSLNVLTGPHRSQTFGFGQRTRCLVGRSSECLVNLSGSHRDMLISRRHCALEIDGSAVWVRDLGSRNGTFINGRRLGINPSDTPANGKEVSRGRLEDGDILTIGGTSLRVSITPVEENATLPVVARTMTEQVAEPLCFF
jgi:serine/threonine-protein kinase